MSDAPHPSVPIARDLDWLRTVRLARWLAWASLGWMTAEGGAGPGVAVESIRDLALQHRPDATALGIALTISSLAPMPALGIAERCCAEDGCGCC